jgi:hypothetical protein
MFGRTGIFLLIEAFALATPVAAQAPAPTTTAFDGTHLGMSVNMEGYDQVLTDATWTRACHEDRPPPPLTIVNGLARTSWGAAEGPVSPQGVLAMRTTRGDHIDGRIDGQGSVWARFTSGCSYQLVWQKVPAPTMPFDGDYVGVSRESSCLANRVPVTLIIRNGVVVHGGSWQGNVNPQGVVVMGNRLAPRVDGQIDSQGTIRAQGSSSDGGCTVTFVWRKQAS